MAKLPDENALGADPSLSAGRPIASVDTTAVAKGVANLGKGIADLGEGVAYYKAGQDREQKANQAYDLTKRKSEFTTGSIKLDSDFDQDPDFKTRQPRYEEAIGKLRAKVLEGASPRVAEQFTIHTDPLVARAVDKQKDTAFKLKNDYDTAQTREDGDNLINAGAGVEDRETRTRIIETQHDRIDALYARGAITAQQQLAMKQQWVHHFATTDFLKRAERDPEGAVNDLRVQPGSMSEIANRVIQIESGGDPRSRSTTSSAYGAAQFLRTSSSDQTWLNLVKEFRPDLAQGKSVAEIDEMRADPNLSREMLMKLLEKNQGILTRQGVEATPAALYLSHFLGPKSAVAVLQASPGRPVADVLTDAVGPKMAQMMVEANQSVLGGRQAGSVVQWASSKMGGNDRVQMYRMLPAETRAKMLDHGLQLLHKQRVDDSVQFKARVEDSTAEAGVTGEVQKPIGQWEFIARLGYEAGKKQYEKYTADVQLGADAAADANRTEDQRRAVLESYTPKPGDGFLEQTKRYKILSDAMKHNDEAKRKDPANFAITRLPAVKGANAQFEAALSDPLAPPEAKQAAARQFGDTMLLEQQRIGVPASERRIVTDGYVEMLNKRLTDPKAAGGALNVAAAIEHEASLWGAHWPTVYKDIAKKSGPIVRVIGSGIRPQAAQLLTEFRDVKLGDIANDQDDTRLKQIKTDVLAAMKPFAASLVGNEGGQKVFDDFQSQAEKLAAYYVRTGKTSSDAGTQAFDDLLGHKYHFVGSTGFLGFGASNQYRIPKSIPFTSTEIEIGAGEARDKLSAFNLKPARDTVGGLTPEMLDRETLRAYRRDGVWVTAPDESGLALIYKDQAVRKADGKPLVVPWATLADMAKSGAEARRTVPIPGPAEFVERMVSPPPKVAPAPAPARASAPPRGVLGPPSKSDLEGMGL